MRNKNNKHLGIEVEPELHHKIRYSAKYEGRSINGQILYVLRQFIKEFEQREGASPPEAKEETKSADMKTEDSEESSVFVSLRFF